jgi:fructose-bisphosphate aldolase, class II
MPFADYARFGRMTEHAMDAGFAYPAVNVHDMFTLNAVIEGFDKAGSDGIVQIYPDAARAVSGLADDPVLGAVSLAEHAHRIAARSDVNVALHTDHCSYDQLDGFLIPLIEESERRNASGLGNLFTSHMFDGSTLPLKENLTLSRELLSRCSSAGLWLEIEVGIVGAENSDGANTGDKLYTGPDDFLKIREYLGDRSNDRYLVAPAFGNVHGVYRPGEVVLEPGILASCQQALTDRYGPKNRFPLVFHGGSGSTDEEIRAVVGHGAVKMNIDTDGQYAFTRRIADYFFTQYGKVLRIDGDVGVKSAYFAETWLRQGAESLRDYVASMCELLGSAGESIGD